MVGAPGRPDTIAIRGRKPHASLKPFHLTRAGGKNGRVEVASGRPTQAAEWASPHPQAGQGPLRDPQQAETPDEVIIQSHKRIAKINLVTGKGVLSDGKNDAYFMHLHPSMGAKPIDVPQSVIDELKKIIGTPANNTGPVRIL